MVATNGRQLLLQTEAMCQTTASKDEQQLSLTSFLIIALSNTHLFLLPVILLIYQPTVAAAPQTLANRNRKSCGCSSGGGSNVIDCRHRGLESLADCDLPADANSSSSSLDITDNRQFARGRLSRSVLPPGELSRIRSLALDRCALTMVHSWAFSRTVFPALEVVRLSDNELHAVGQNAFDELSNLVEVWLDGNRLERLWPRTFARLGRLRALHLERNRFVAVPAEGLAGSVISSLHLDFNYIRKVDGRGLLPLTSTLRTLTLARNKYRSLIITSDSLSSIHLAMLDLSFSGIEDPSFLSRSDIDELDLSGNPPVARRLNSQSCNLTSRKIILKRMDLETVETAFFGGMSRLQEIDLSENRIGTIKDGAFRTVSIELRSLNLAHNRLEHLSGNWFHDLSNVEQLNLTGNQLEAVPVEWLERLSRLRSLDLSENRFQTVSERLQNTLQALSAMRRKLTDALVDLSGNPFHCNCELERLRDWVRDNEPEDRQRRYVCRTPPSASGPIVDRHQLPCRTPAIVGLTNSPTMIGDGREVFLSCTADADPAPAVEWISPRGETFTVVHRSADRQRTRTTAIWRVKIGPEIRLGVFVCRASNVAGQAINVSFVGFNLTTVTAPGENHYNMASTTSAPDLSALEVVTTRVLTRSDSLTSSRSQQPSRSSKASAATAQPFLQPTDTLATIRTPQSTSLTTVNRDNSQTKPNELINTTVARMITTTERTAIPESQLSQSTTPTSLSTLEPYSHNGMTTTTLKTIRPTTFRTHYLSWTAAAVAFRPMTGDSGSSRIQPKTTTKLTVFPVTERTLTPTRDQLRPPSPTHNIKEAVEILPSNKKSTTTTTRTTTETINTTMQTSRDEQKKLSSLVSPRLTSTTTAGFTDGTATVQLGETQKASNSALTAAAAAGDVDFTGHATTSSTELMEASVKSKQMLTQTLHPTTRSLPSTTRSTSGPKGVENTRETVGFYTTKTTAAARTPKEILTTPGPGCDTEVEFSDDNGSSTVGEFSSAESYSLSETSLAENGAKPRQNVAPTSKLRSDTHIKLTSNPEILKTNSSRQEIIRSDKEQQQFHHNDTVTTTDDDVKILSPGLAELFGSHAFIYGVGWIVLPVLVIVTFVVCLYRKRRDQRYRVGPVTLTVMHTVTAVCHV